MDQAQPVKRRILLLVWDGLRPDLVSPDLTPVLWRLRERGVWFERSHCVFPSETRVNSPSLATGAYPPVHGIVGNTMFVPVVDMERLLDTGDHLDLASIERVAGPLLYAVPFGTRVLEAGGSVVVVSSGSPGSAVLVNPTAHDERSVLVNRAVIEPMTLAPVIERRFGAVPPSGTPAIAQNQWVTRVLTEWVLAELQPTVAVCWLRDPDTTQHARGLGSRDALASLEANDLCLDLTLIALERLGLAETTDIILTSDHGFCWTEVTAGANVTAGLVEAGLKVSAQSQDVVSGSGTLSFSAEAMDRAGAVVAWLQAQPWMGNVFVRDGGPAAGLAGTIPLSTVWGAPIPEHIVGRCPDVSYTYKWSEETNEYGMPGAIRRGSGVATHGSASPFDMQNTLVAAGPSFRSGYVSDVPCGIVDVAPTLLHILGLPALPTAQGRVLVEALRGEAGAADASVPAHRDEEITAEARLADGGRYKQGVRLARTGDTVYFRGGWSARSG
jgi:arylsulfatase A-like enzyme